MNILTFIVFGFIAYWIYFSIKKEGIFWIPKAVIALGSFVLWMTLNYKVFNFFLSTPFYYFKSFIAGIIFAIIIFPISYRLLDLIEKKIEERVGKNPYK